jgi:hypothetical protein
MIENAEFYVSYHEAGSSWSTTKTYPDDHTTWKELLHDFLKFLDGAYGYDISGQVTIEPAVETRRMSQMDLFDDDFKGDPFSYGGSE